MRKKRPTMKNYKQNCKKYAKLQMSASPAAPPKKYLKPIQGSKNIQAIK
ncbi:MAG: hypothetical protein GH148_01980 [Clostridia bacterium]|nr:hypothetical protein [Clostridia bacterium]